MHKGKLFMYLCVVLVMAGYVTSSYAKLIEKSGWSFTASPEAKGKAATIDGKGKSWNTGMMQKKGDYFQIELPRAQILNGAVIFQNGTGTSLKVSLDGSKWVKVASSSARQFKFPSIKAKFVRVVLNESQPKTWKIREIYLFDDKAQPVTIDNFETGRYKKYWERTKNIEVNNGCAHESAYGLKYDLPGRGDFQYCPKYIKQGIPIGGIFLFNNCDALTLWIKGGGMFFASLHYFIPCGEAYWKSQQFSADKKWRKIILPFNYFKFHVSDYKKKLSKKEEKELKEEADFSLRRMYICRITNKRYNFPASGCMDEIKAESFVQDFSVEGKNISYKLLDEAKSAVIKVYPADKLYVAGNKVTEIEGKTERGSNEITWQGFDKLSKGTYTAVIQVKGFLGKPFATHTARVTR